MELASAVIGKARRPHSHRHTRSHPHRAASNQTSWTQRVQQNSRRQRAHTKKPSS